MYEVDAPRKAITHIQNTAPGPPNAIAVATPAMLPMPTRPDSDIARAWNDDTPATELAPPSSSATISRTLRSCTNRVRIENQSPAPRHRTISGVLQISPFRALTNSSTHFSPYVCHHGPRWRGPADSYRSRPFAKPPRDPTAMIIRARRPPAWRPRASRACAPAH